MVRSHKNWDAQCRISMDFPSAYSVHHHGRQDIEWLLWFLSLRISAKRRLHWIELFGFARQHLPCRPRSPCSFSGMHSTWFNRIQPHSTCWTCLTIGVGSFQDPGLHSWDSDNIYDDQGAITDSLFPSCKAREDAFLGDTMRCGSQVAQPMTPIYTHTHLHLYKHVWNIKQICHERVISLTTCYAKWRKISMSELCLAGCAQAAG
jgi:hypothetical protein